MPKISEIFSSRFLKAEHLNGKPRVVTIDGWSTEVAYGEDVYVIHLADELRSLRLSPTCARDIAQVCGDEMEQWAGHEIEIYPMKQKITDKETNTEKLVDMIRARPVPGAVTAKTITAPTKKPSFDDGIPF